MATLPGSPSEWYAELTRIARQEVFRVMRRKASSGGLPFTVREMISTLVHEAWAVITGVERALENVYGYARIVIRYRLISYIHNERARRWIAASLLSDENDDNDTSTDLVRIAVDPWDDIDLAIAADQLQIKREAYHAQVHITPAKTARTRQAEQQARARLMEWYQNSKRRRYD